VLIGAAISHAGHAAAGLGRSRPTRHDLGLLAFLGLFQLAIPCVLSVLCARVLKGAAKWRCWRCSK
jgi:hypothetical protein